MGEKEEKDGEGEAEVVEDGDTGIAEPGAGSDVDDAAVAGNELVDVETEENVGDMKRGFENQILFFFLFLLRKREEPFTPIVACERNSSQAKSSSFSLDNRHVFSNNRSRLTHHTKKKKTTKKEKHINNSGFPPVFLSHKEEITIGNHFFFSTTVFCLFLTFV